jgi:ubiquinone/menaquinone biosynthesis C-methylase UbiE
MSTARSTSVNHWPDSACAKAFWGQQEVPAYQRLLCHTTEWLEPKPGDRWLDLGCGGGRLTRALWEKSGGSVAEIIGLDCAAENEVAFRRLRQSSWPTPSANQIRFQCADFSNGLASWSDAHFSGVVSGLAIQYAESYCSRQSRWTSNAYDHLLREVFRVLQPQGAFVFSVNVPQPAWGRLALRSWKGFFRTNRPLRFLKRSWRMMRYGAWLSREAGQGRFHYLPIEQVVEKLASAGFVQIEYRLTFARLAYLIRCRKP